MKKLINVILILMLSLVLIACGKEAVQPSVVPDPEATPQLSPASTLEDGQEATATPTLTPTDIPTPDEGTEPTSTPTQAPTATPTVAPTVAPTATPTATPAATPTATPTVTPTATPTVAPTATPTVAPTATPTLAPTQTPKPSNTPTLAPTQALTQAPKPSNTPTSTPTQAPKPSNTPIPTVALTPLPKGEFRLGNSSYGYEKFELYSNASEKMMLYMEMRDVCEEFICSNEDVAERDGGLVIGEFNYAAIGLSDEDALAVWKVFYIENPAYYWLANSVTVDGRTLFFCIDQAFAKASDRRKYDADIAKMENECSEKLKSAANDLEKALIIHDYIILKIEYATKNDGTPSDEIWAHNMIGVASKNLGVCESYAKTYMYLCLKNGVKSIIVTGTANGDQHAWNYIKIADNWYGVDCTWDDTGKSGVTHIFFGMCKEFDESTRKTDTTGDTGAQYLYDVPELSERNMQVVHLYEGNTSKGTFENIDAALAKINNSNGEYTIQCIDYSINSDGMMAFYYTYTEYVITTAVFPRAKKITMKGFNKDLEEDYYTVGYVRFGADVKVNSELIMDDLQLLSVGEKRFGLDMGTNKLSIIGRHAYVNVDIVSRGECYFACEEAVDFMNGTIDAETVVADGKLLFRNNATIKNLQMNYDISFFYCKNIQVDIDILTYKNGNIWLDGLEYGEVNLGTIKKAPGCEWEYIYTVLSTPSGDKMPHVYLDSIPEVPLAYSYVSEYADFSGTYPEGWSVIFDRLQPGDVVLYGANLDKRVFFAFASQERGLNEAGEIVDINSYWFYQADIDKVLVYQDNKFIFMGWPES